jgi:DNA-binding winged helix-turn-helix (wHTH) protein
MLKLADLAARPDFRVGPLTVSPSRRLVEGPAGQVNVEPLIMQVFLLLLDAGGKVVTRNELFDQLWGGVMVGDDSLNRAIAKVRRIGADVAPGFFEIETIPRTGYRITGEILDHFDEAGAEAGSATKEAPAISRRALVGGGVAAAAIAGAGGLWLINRSDPRFDAMMRQGEEAMDYGSPGTSSAKYFREAAAIRPRDARAQGLLATALAQRAEFEPPPGIEAIVREAAGAAQAALAIDPNEPHALMAMCLLQRSTLDLASFEDRTRAILARDPGNVIAMRQLWGMLQTAGRSHDALALIDRALAMKPLAAGNNFPKAQLLWILGRVPEADRVIDRAMQYWPNHWYVRAARFAIFAYAGRPRAALAMLDDEATRPQIYGPASVALWRVSLAALDQRSPASIATARKANLEAAERDLKLSTQAICVLSALGQVDAAFEIVDALFAVRAAADARLQSATVRGPVRSTAWRFAPWLFIPPTAALRADPRFQSLCDGIGLTEYWAKRGIKPDYQLGIV